MQTLSLKFASMAAAVAAFKAADPRLVGADDQGVDQFVAAGFDAYGARFDIVATDIVAPTGSYVESPSGDQIAVVAPTGEVQVDLIWQGQTLPTISGGQAVGAPAVAIATPPAVVEAPAETISRRQFALACHQLDLMTDAEVDAFLSTNDVPQLLMTAIDKMPEAIQAPTKWTVMGSVVFQRSNPATVALMGLVDLPPGYTNAAALRDAIWTLGAKFP